MSTVLELVNEFDREPTVASRALREMRVKDANKFLDEAFRDLLALPDSAGATFALRMLLTGEDGLYRLADPTLLAIDEALQLARRMRALDANFDVRFLRLLLPHAERPCDVRAATRVLEIVEAICDGNRIRVLLQSLLRHDDVRVRSKAALMAGRFSRNLAWVQQFLAEPDSRIRANAIESLWGQNSSEACKLFLAATADLHHRVVGNGIVGLHRAGDLAAISAALNVANHSDPMFRTAAAWAMGETQNPRFLSLLARMVETSSGSVRQNALRAMVRIRKSMAELNALEALDVKAAWLEDSLKVEVRNREGALVPGLPATGFLLAHQEGEFDITSVREEGGDYWVSLAESRAGPVRLHIYSPKGKGECVV